ncbi:hypothetical protein ACU686_09970 [Yinghuangia aomiensis]
MTSRTSRRLVAPRTHRPVRVGSLCTGPRRPRPRRRRAVPDRDLGVDAPTTTSTSER